MVRTFAGHPHRDAGDLVEGRLAFRASRPSFAGPVLRHDNGTDGRSNVVELARSAGGYQSCDRGSIDTQSGSAWKVAVPKVDLLAEIHESHALTASAEARLPPQLDRDVAR
jgi:hypothetical protein